MNTIAIVQARMSSTRLPGKVLHQIASKPVLGHVLDRLNHCAALDKIIVATSTSTSDDPIEEFITKETDYCCFRGNLTDVLDRSYKTAKWAKAQNVVRICADSPLIDPNVVESVIRFRDSYKLDYAGNTLYPTMPDGLDCECFTFSALEKSWKEASLKSDREHVTPYIRTNSTLFSLGNLYLRENISHLCWALDSEADLHFLEAVADSIDITCPVNYHYAQIVNLIRTNRELIKINASSIRDEKLLEERPEIFSKHNDQYQSYCYEPGVL